MICFYAPGACAVNNTVLEETPFDAKNGEKIHTLYIRWMILFLLFYVSLWLISTSFVQDVLCCAVSSWSQLWWSISSSLSCWRWSGAMWAHLQASVKSDLGAAPLQPWLPSEGGFFQHNTGDANGSISTTRYTETHLGSSPCNHGNRRILLVGSSQ